LHAESEIKANSSYSHKIHKNLRMLETKLVTFEEFRCKSL